VADVGEEAAADDMMPHDIDEGKDETGTAVVDGVPANESSEAGAAETPTFSSIPHSTTGFMSKEAGSAIAAKKYDERFFILEKGVLSYYGSEKPPKGSNIGVDFKAKIPLKGTIVTEDLSGERSLILLTPTPEAQTAEGKPLTRVYKFEVNDHKARAAWINGMLYTNHTHTHHT
jgi:hypothetical protein